MARALTLLLLLLFSALSLAQLPAFRIGGSLSRCGRGADISTAMWDALKFYENYTNANGGIVINGTQHRLELILYGTPKC